MNSEINLKVNKGPEIIKQILIKDSNDNSYGFIYLTTGEFANCQTTSMGYFNILHKFCKNNNYSLLNAINNMSEEVNIRPILLIDIKKDIFNDIKYKLPFIFYNEYESTNLSEMVFCAINVTKESIKNFKNIHKLGDNY